jgi:hypothetical protein
MKTNAKCTCPCHTSGVHIRHIVPCCDETYEQKIGWPAQFQKKPTQAELMALYYPQHCCCPTCGGCNLETTCVGYMFKDLETAEDSNKATCECGWRGIVHDLVPAKEV